MRAVLKLEEIGYNTYRDMRSWGVHMPSRAWVKELYLKFTVLSVHVETKWVKANSYDYSEANSVGSRGVYKYYWLEDGKIYQVNSPQSWKRDDNYYCFISNGEIKELTYEEAVSCLSLPLD